ncbi:Multidrug resistance protein MdtA [Emticicia aquatica]|uniref:Multidrug resistance protein MdtA n=1 Tax=Emticicia aquatica TaxID=1681835 RepID=A0ABM9AQE2_9BACT|nr:efflux RND transporter periplasmic adaptor subunit [Emticicia aquatica]CAH0996155.1 Multidrug resistance protein MdtA [Emticicia aquatica]
MKNLVNIDKSTNAFNAITILILTVLISACGSKKKAEETTDSTVIESTITNLSEKQVQSIGITTGALEQKTFSTILKVSGKVDVPPQNLISVSVPLGGYLKSTHLMPGMFVRKGESIAIIEDQQYIQLQQDFLTIQSKIGFLENEYQRQKELNQSKASSDKVFQQAEMELKTQKILVKSLAEKLKLAGINPEKLNENTISKSINISSPINGYVSKVNVNIGKFIAPTDVMFELVNTSDIHLALKVFEKDLDKLSIGQKVVAFTNTYPDKKYPCEILLIGKSLSEERNTDVHCHFEVYDKALIPGTYMNAEIAITNAKSYVLPEDAIVRYENKYYVFVKKAATQFEMVEVQIGNTEKGLTEIIKTENLNNQTFVIKGAYSLLMSLKNKSEE